MAQGITSAFDYCPECDIKIYKRGGYYTCPIHGKYERTILTEELVKACSCDDCVCTDARQSGYNGA